MLWQEVQWFLAPHSCILHEQNDICSTGFLRIGLAS